MKKMLFGGVAILIIIAVVYYYVGNHSNKTLVGNMSLTRLPVQFSHEAMQEIDCVICHHLIDGEENFSKCSYSGCHDILGSNARREVHSYYRIAHEPNPNQYYSCIKCHLEIVVLKPELKSQLTDCSGSSCHPQ